MPWRTTSTSNSYVYLLAEYVRVSKLMTAMDRKYIIFGVNGFNFSKKLLNYLSSSLDQTLIDKT